MFAEILIFANGKSFHNKNYTVYCILGIKLQLGDSSFAVSKQTMVCSFLDFGAC